MDKQIKAPKGIKIIAVMMLIGSLCVIFWCGPTLISVITSLLFIIGGIGLWKIKRWGLVISCLALSGVIFPSTKEAITCLRLKKIPGVITENPDDYLPLILHDYGIPIFICISILYYLLRKRRCFYEQ